MTTTLTLRFSEKIQKGTGNITILNGAATFASIPVTDARVVITSDSVVTIDPPVDLPSLGRISVVLVPGLFQDLAGNPSPANTSLPWRFTTADVEPPVVNEYEPATGATGVLPNARLRLVFNEKVKKAVGTITIRKNGISQGIAVSNAAVTVADSIVTIVPPTPLPLNTRISVQITPGSFVDLSENPYEGIAVSDTNTWHFNTLNDTEPPRVTRLQPRDDTTNVPLDARLVLVFNERVNKLPGGSLLVIAGGVPLSPIPVSGSNVVISGAGGNVVTVTLPQPLPAGADVYVLVIPNSFADDAGNPFAGITDPTRWNFRTLDNTPPTVQTQLPPNGSTNIPSFTSLVLTFSEPVRKGTGNITLSQGSGNPPIVIDVTDGRVVVNGTVVSVTLPQPLASGATVSVTMPSGIFTDSSGNPFAGFTAGAWSFGVADTQPPALVANSFDPADNATNVPRNRSLRSVFNERVRKGIGDILVWENNVPTRVPVANANVIITGDTVTINYAAIKSGGFAPGAEVFVQIPFGTFADLAGNPFTGLANPADWNFTVLDDVKPTVTQLSPANGAADVFSTTNLVMTFSKPVRAGSGSNNRILIYQAGTPTPTLLETIAANNTAKVIVTGSTVTILNNPLPIAGVTVYVNIEAGAFSDNSGNFYDGISAPTQWRFQVRDTQKPTIASLNPTNGQQNVAVNAPLTIAFSEPIRKGTAGQALIFSRRGTLPPVDLANISVAGNTATIPHPPFLSNDTLYVLVFPNTFVDTAGNAFDGIISDQTWRFTTADIDIPQISSFTPPNGASGVPLNTNLTIVFSENIRKGTAGNIRLRGDNGVDIQTISVTETLVQVDGRTATVRLRGNLPTATNVHVLIDNAAFADLSGNPFPGISSSTTWVFTTLDLNAPFITTYTPARDAVNQPANTNLTFAFNKDIQKGGGNIRIQVSGVANPVVIPVTDANVFIRLDRRTVDVQLSTFFPNGLPSGGVVSVTMDNGVFVDLANGNRFAGIDNSNPWRFTVNDIIPPSLLTFLPANDATNVPVNTTLTLNFSEPVRAGAGRILVRRTSNSSVIFALNASQGTGLSSASVTYTLPGALPSEENIHILIENTAFTDLSSLPYAGISDPTVWAFRTGDITPPTVRTYSPDRDERNVPLTRELELTFSEPVRRAASGTVTVNTGGQVEQIDIGAATFSTDSTTIRFNRTFAFASGQRVFVLIPGGLITDRSGNAYAGLASDTAWRFTAIDNVAPQAEQFTPAKGAVNVPPNTALSIRFSKPVRQGSGSIFISQQSNITVPNPNIVISPDLRTVTLPNTDFTAGSVTVIIPPGAFADTTAAANPYEGVSDWTFTVADIVVPRVVSTSPASNETNVSPTVTLLVTFNKEILKNAGNIIVTPAGGNQQNIAISSAAVGVVGTDAVSIRLPQSLPSGATVTVSIPAGGFIDRAGNLSVGYQWSFVVADVLPPTIASRTPLDNATGVPRNSPLTFAFSEQVNAIQDSVRIFINQVQRYVFSVASLQLTGNRNTVTITLPELWPSSAAVYVQIPAGAYRDLAGNPFAGITNNTGWNFTIEDYIAPTITDHSPKTPPDAPINTNLTLTFSEPVRRGLGSISIQPSQGNAVSIPLTDTQRIRITGNTVTIVPGAFASNATVNVTIPAGAFTDLADNPLAAEFRWTFKVVDIDIPFVTRYSPTDDSTNVPVNRQLVMVFSKPVRKNTGNITITVNGQARPPIPVTSAAVTIGADQETVTIDPFSALFTTFPSEAAVFVTMPPGVFVDLSSNANAFPGISSPTTWNFTIADVLPPQLASQLPANGATGVPVDAELVLAFNEPVVIGAATDSITIAQSTGAREQIAMNDPRVRISGSTVRITPARNFDSEATVSVQIPATALQDRSGNRLAAVIGWSFRAADIIPPTVQRLTPTNNQTSVPITAPLVMVFSEKVQKLTGRIILAQAGGQPQFVNVTSDSVRISTITEAGREVSQVTIQHQPFTSGTTVSVIMFDNVFADLAGNPFAGLQEADSWRFTVADIQFPEIVSRYPDDEATNIPPTAELIINFSEPMRRGVGDDKRITLSFNGQGLSYRVNTDTDVVRFTEGASTVFIKPRSALPSGARITVTIANGAFTDLEGNPFGLTDLDAWNFTIADVTNPIVRTFDPAPGSNRVPQDKVLSITFDKPVRTATGFIRIFRTGSPEPLLTIDVRDTERVKVTNDNLRVVQITPRILLPSGSNLYVTADAGSFEDLNGNPFFGIGVNEWEFSVQDVIPPRVTATRPSTGATNVAPDTPLEITFSEAVDPVPGKRLFIYVNGVVRDSVLATNTRSAVAGRTRYVVPTRPFNSEDRVYILIDSAFADLAGNRFAGFRRTTDWSFSIADVNPPRAVTFRPRNGSTFIKVDTILSIDFNEPVRASSNGLIILNEGSSSRPLEVSNSDVVRIVNNGRTVQILPPNGLPFRSDILVQIPAGTFTDESGNPYAGVNPDATDKRWGFRTVPPPDLDSPQVANLSPRDEAVDVPLNTSLVITFNEPVFGTQRGTIAVGSQNADLRDPAQAQRWLRFENNLQTGVYQLTITPPNRLPPNTNLSVQISADAIVDSVGNRFTGFLNDQQWNFLTADPSDTIPPQVRVLDPRDGASNVPVSSNLKILFSETVRKGTGEIIINNNNQPRPINVNDPAVTVSGNLVVINPTFDLASGANVNIIVPPGAFTDLAGNRFVYDGKRGIPDPDDWNFSTAEQTDRTAPVVGTLEPDQNTVARANTSRLVITFSKPVKKYEGAITIRQNGAPTVIEVTSSSVVIDPANAARVFINLSAGFAPGASVEVTMPSSVFVDLADNSFAGFTENNPWRFSIEDREPPRVVAYYPLQNSEGVPRNTNLMLTFNEPIRIADGTAQVTILGSDIAPQSIPLNDPRVRVYGNTLEINPSTDLPLTNDWISVQIQGRGITDFSNNPTANISDLTTWRFKVGAFIDNIPPKLFVANAFDPATGRRNVDNNTVLRVRFDERIQKGRGKVVLRIDDQPLELDVTDPIISVADSQLVIRPTAPFPFLARVSVLMDAGAVTDRAGNAFAGIGDPTEWSFVIENAPPVELAVPPRDLMIADTLRLIQVQAQISQRLPGLAAKFYYRGITKPASAQWIEETLALQGLAYTATVSRDTMNADPLGVEYYFELAFDPSLNVSPVRSLVQYAYHDHIRGKKVPNLRAGSNVTDYQIVSVPLELEKSGISEVFVDDFGLYDTRRWRLFHFNAANQESEEFQRGLSNILPGEGYWFITRNQAAADTLDTGKGGVVRSNRNNPYAIALSPGWNQIGNPYDFNVRWEDVLKANPALDSTAEFITYEGAYKGSDVMPRFRGGFVNVESDVRIVIPTTKQKSANGGRVTREFRATFTKGAAWEVNFGLQARETTYDLAGAGMHPNATVGKDPFDRVALPRLPQHLDIRFDHPESFARYFSKDMVPTQDSYTWEFTVGSGLPAQQVVLSWLAKLPAASGKQWMLFDVQQNRAIDLTRLSEYRFWLDKSALFRLYYGSPEYIRENMKPEFGSLGQIYPNPFSKSTTVPFALAENGGPYQVRVDVYSVTGVRVATLAEGTFEDGLHEVTWDGRGTDGSRVPSGVYVCQMQVSGKNGQSVYRKKVVVQ